MVSTTTIFLRTWMEAGRMETGADHGPGLKWSLPGTQTKVYSVDIHTYLGLDLRRLQSVSGNGQRMIPTACSKAASYFLIDSVLHNWRCY